MGRDCGECVLCCVIWRIPDLDKSANVVCEYLSKEPGVKNCTIYDDPKRPEACARFRCGWLQGDGDEKDRPDKSGAIPCREGVGIPRDFVVPVATDSLQAIANHYTRD